MMNIKSAYLSCNNFIITTFFLLHDRLYIQNKFEFKIININRIEMEEKKFIQLDFLNFVHNNLLDDLR